MSDISLWQGLLIAAVLGIALLHILAVAISRHAALHDELEKARDQRANGDRPFLPEFFSLHDRSNER